MNQKTIRTILIIVLILVNILLFVVNKVNTCDKCEIKFIQTTTSGVSHNPLVYVYTPNELYDSLLNNSCVISWDRVGGYHANKRALV